jgi:ribosomal protein S15P/S13E
MKTSDRTPSEVIDYIGNIIREREQKSLPTFYTISIEQYEKNTPVAEKEGGYDNFKKQVLKYMSDYNLTAITIQLFSGKSHNVKHPFQTFKVQLKKQNPTIILGGLGNIEKSNNEVQQLDSSIPVSRYYDEKFELQIRIMRIELEKQTLTDRIVQLTERYEDKLKEQDSRNGETVKRLEEEIESLEEEIKELENEILKNEKDKHNSFGNVALGSISARAMEGFAKSNIGTGLLKGLLGEAGYETLQGHLAGIEKEKTETPEKPTARVISEPETDPRTIALNYIQKVGEALPDMYLRMLYDIAELANKNVQDLQVVWNLIQQIKQQRAKTAEQKNNQQPATEPEQKEEEEEEEDETGEDDTTNLP